MPVHAESQISTWIDDFYHDFYVSLTDKENDCYTRSSGSEKDRWKPLFLSLNTQMTSWKSVSRNTSLTNMTQALYTYANLGYCFNITPSNLPNIDAYYIFNMGGFVQSTLGRSVGYYDDLYDDDPSPAHEDWQSSKITADKSTISGYSSTESSRISNVSTYSSAAATEMVSKSLYGDVPAIANPTKAFMWNKIFNDLHYAKIYTALSTLTVPADPGGGSSGGGSGGGSGSGSITISVQADGTLVASGINTLNFVGATVTNPASGVAQITVSSGGGVAGSVPTFVQQTAPTVSPPYVWYKTNVSNEVIDIIVEVV